MKKNKKDLVFDIKGKDLTVEAVCDILDKVILEYSKTPNQIFYGLMLTQAGLKKSKRHYWSKKHPEEVGARLDYLREITSDKFDNALVNPDPDARNATNMIFYAKTTLKRVEEYNRLKLENDKKELDIYEHEVEIGFEDEN
jgi:hypothetical protein